MAPIEFKKLRIEELRKNREDQYTHKMWLDEERARENLTEDDYKKAQKAANTRIISLGTDLWQQVQDLKQEEIKAGVSLPLGPDSDGAFAAKLMELYKDPIRNRSAQAQTAIRRVAIKRYESGKGAPLKGKLRCTITGDWFDAEDVVARYIVPRRLGPAIVDYIFNGFGSRIDTADNCIMMHHNLERSFRQLNFVLMPANPGKLPLKSWKVQIINDAAAKTDAGRTKLKELNGKEVVWQNDERPATRFLYFHFVLALLLNKRERNPGWEKYLTQLPSGRPFATPGKYIRHSMLLVLSRLAGNSSPEEELRMLGTKGEELIETDSKLDDLTEEEIGRRVIDMDDAESEGDEDEDEDEDEYEEKEEDENEDESTV